MRSEAGQCNIDHITHRVSTDLYNYGCQHRNLTRLRRENGPLFYCLYVLKYVVGSLLTSLKIIKSLGGTSYPSVACFICER